MQPPRNAIQMHVCGLSIDNLSNVPVLELADEGDENGLRIWVGLMEAGAIASELEFIESPRPMCHDLMRAMMQQMGGELVCVEIADLKNSTFFANLHVQVRDVVHVIDSRPSDAIALALRCHAPIFVARDVLEKAGESQAGLDGHDRPHSKEEWAEVLDNLGPSDFGKYRM